MSDTYSREIIFPFRVDTKGGIYSSNNLVEAAASRLKTFILTSFGERVMRPNHGTSARSLLFDTDSLIFANELKSEIMESINNTERNITVIDVKISSGERDSELNVDISFQVYPLNEVYTTSTAFTPTFSE